MPVIHGFVNGFIMLPNFGPALAPLRRDKAGVTSASGPARAPDSSAPQPPGARPDRSCCSVYGSIPQCFRAGFVPARFFVRRFSGSLFARRRHRVRWFAPNECMIVAATAARPSGSAAIDQWSEAIAAPSIAPGVAALPLCRTTATASTPSVFTSAIGMLQVSALPVHTPSFTHLRTTLW